MNTQENTVLNVFRVIGERRIPYIIELDSTMTVVVDRPDIDLLKNQVTVATGAKTVPPTTVNSETTNKDFDLDAIKATSFALQQKMLSDENIAAVDRRLKTVNMLKEAVNDGRITLNANAKLLEDYPELASIAQGELSSIAQGETVESETGGVKSKIYKPTPIDIKVAEWVVKSVENNPLPGTDALRAEYFADEKELRDKHAADGTVCKPCEAGALIRKYRAKLEALKVI